MKHEQKEQEKSEFDFTVELKKERYQIERFTDAHMLAMLDMFTTRMADIQSQSKAGCSIKEIIIPTIPDEIISVNKNGLYVIHLNIQELNYLALHIIKAYHQYELQDIAAGKKSKVLLDEAKQRIASVQEALDVINTQAKLENTINLSLLSPEETEEAKRTKISELQEQLKKLKEV